ncbi:MAG TPA: hypothetical protein VEQ58_06475 [Polyangiaceae bacterium]|nr:hypothetical protein [Polyangiaceae bacterium]
MLLTRCSSIVLLLLAVACSSDPTAPEASGGAAGTSAGNVGGAGKAGASGSQSTSCPAGTNPHSELDPLSVGVVSGKLVDENGEPTTGGLVQVCGTDICRNASVGQNGKFVEDVQGPINAPACKFGDGFDWAKLALPLSAGDSDLGTLITVRLPDYANGVPLEPGQSVTSGGVTLHLDEAAHVQQNVIDYETEDERVFRAVALPEAALAQLEQDFVQGFALSPLETRICPSPSISLENSAQLDPGTELELYLLGLDAEEEFVPYATWQKVGEGQVSDDGASLEFPDGVPLLTAIGVRVKP